MHKSCEVGGGGLELFCVSPRPLGFRFGAKGLGPGLDKRQSSLHDDSLPLPVEQSTTQRKVQVQESRGQKLMHLIAEFADQ